MYTVYVNDCPLRFAHEAPPDAPALTLRYSGKTKLLLQVIGTLEGGRNPHGAVLLSPQPEKMWLDFQNLFTIIEAAGGAVLNQERLLCIYRRGSWDLPKGKLDAGENAQQAALREVEEETGVRSLSLGKQLPSTYHTYRTGKGKPILKPTYWFEMQTSQEALIAQSEEDIELAQWVALSDLGEVYEGMYKSLRVVVDALRAGHEG